LYQAWIAAYLEGLRERVEQRSATRGDHDGWRGRGAEVWNLEERFQAVSTTDQEFSPFSSVGPFGEGAVRFDGSRIERFFRVVSERSNGNDV
jgi:hypothetical protein